MLSIRKTIQFNGESKINDIPVKFYYATIVEDNPEGLAINTQTVNNELYKANRSAVNADQAAFENAVYLFQESLIAEQEAQQ